MSQDESLSQLDPKLRAFWTYWNGLPKDNFIPNLGDYLDNAPPALQPFVVIMDLTSPDDMRVRLTGTAMVDFAGEMTGTEAEVLYRDKTRRMAMAMAWTATTHPCGYIADRILRSKHGHLIRSPGLVLPVRPGTPGTNSVIGFQVMPNRSEGLAEDDQIEAVQSVTKQAWVDIGAGTPG